MKNLKIKLLNHDEFKKAWKILIKLGYHCGNYKKPVTAPYLYTYEDGKILPDYFDVEGADLTSLGSAEGYFNNSDHEKVTLSELKNMLK